MEMKMNSGVFLVAYFRKSSLFQYLMCYFIYVQMGCKQDGKGPLAGQNVIIRNSHKNPQTFLRNWYIVYKLSPLKCS